MAAIIVVWDLDAAHDAVHRVGGLDLGTGDAEDEQHRVEIRMAQRCVGDLAQRGFGVERHPQPGGGEHVHVIGAVTDGHRLRHRHAGLLREVPQRLGFSRPVDDRPDDAAGQLPVDDLEFVGGDEVHLQLVRERFDDLAEAAGHNAAVIPEAPQRAQRGACAGRQLDLLPDLLEHFGGHTGQRRHPSV